MKKRNTASPKHSHSYNHYYDNKIREFHLNCTKIEDADSPPKKIRWDLIILKFCLVIDYNFWLYIFFIFINKF